MPHSTLASSRSRRPWPALVAAAAAVLVFGRTVAGMAATDVPTPTLEGPITSPGSAFVASTTFDLAQVGYEQAEYFMSGTATAYAPSGPLEPDGRWTVTPAATAPYKTRVLVYRPVDPRRFNGTVVVEWLNVSGGLDAAPDWLNAHTALVRGGFAWVGVSAQRVGIEGGGGLLPIADLPLKAVNPARYGSLAHPGDSFSYDIFSQAGQAIRRATPAPLGGLDVQRVLAVGESQSAFRMTVYVDAVHPVAGVYDGFLVHSRGGGGAFGAPLSEAPQAAVPTPFPTFIREDVDVPVLVLQTETDLTFLLSAAARQDDSAHVRLWEVAGTAHADAYTGTGMADLGDSPDIVGLVLTTAPVPGIITCGSPINAGPQHFVVGAAMVALDRWVARGTAPRPVPRLEVAPGPPLRILHDANGNALGGLRTPQVDVPIAAFSGEQDGTITCRIFGGTTPLDARRLATLYPSHRAFVSAYRKAVQQAVRAGHVLRADGKLMRRWAAGSDVGR